MDILSSCSVNTLEAACSDAKINSGKKGYLNRRRIQSNMYRLFALLDVCSNMRLKLICHELITTDV